MADFEKLIERSEKKDVTLGRRVASRAGNVGMVRPVAIFTMLTLSAVTLWLGFDVAGRLAKVEQKVELLTLRIGVKKTGSDDKVLRAELQELGKRVSDLAVIIEGPFSHLRQSNEESLEALSQRLDRLETNVSAPDAVQPVTTSVGDSSGSEAKKKAAGGGWVINLISLSSEKDAQEQMLKLRKAGVRVEMQHAQHNGKSWYRLRVPGFSSYEGARAYIETVEKQANVENAWVARE